MDTLKLTDAMLFLSTLSLRRATDVIAEITEAQSISIHALLAESDLAARDDSIKFVFLSTLSLRRATCFFCVKLLLQLIFLSTLSLRRATLVSMLNRPNGKISIHALLAESDLTDRKRRAIILYFYPRSPCGERPSAGRL